MDVSKIFEKPLFWILCIATLFLVPLIRSLRQPAVEVPPVLGQISNFKLTNQENREITWENTYKGSVIIANFIFTTCPDVCPMLTQQMAKIQDRILGSGASIKLVSISVDPEEDRPAVLNAYGKKFGARFASWSFLTGDLAQIYDTIVKGFKVSLDGKPYKEIEAKEHMEADLMGITHGENFVIVDQAGQIRGYEHARNDQEINRIMKLVSIIANQNPAFAPKPTSLEVPAQGR